MKVLTTCDFGEFYSSDFFSEFSRVDYDKNETIFESKESKMVSREEREMFDIFFIISFYKRGKERWVKKEEISYEQALYDCEVMLIGDNDGTPTSIIFGVGFEFILSPEMVRALQDAMEYDAEGYYPNLSKK